jgi:hypothetical protein
MEEELQTCIRGILVDDRTQGEGIVPCSYSGIQRFAKAFVF